MIGGRCVLRVRSIALVLVERALDRADASAPSSDWKTLSVRPAYIGLPCSA